MKSMMLGLAIVSIGGWSLAAEDARTAPTVGSLAEGLIGHWTFDASDGKTVADLSPSGNVGAIVDGELSNDNGRKSLVLDGIGAHVRIEQQRPLAYRGGASAALWIQAEDFRSRTALFGVPHAEPNWTTPYLGMYSNGGRLVFGTWLERGKSKVLVEAPGELPLEKWIFVTGTYDGKAVRLYLDAEPVAQAEAEGVPATRDAPLLIGAWSPSRPSFRGRVGELRIYDRSLSADEIRSLYDLGRARFSEAGVASKDFGDGAVAVETHGNSPEAKSPWRAQHTRLLEHLAGYTPGDPIPMSKYGGRTDCPREPATGFFHVKKLGDRVWLIDPEGYRHFHLGIDIVRPLRGRGQAASSGWAEQTTAKLRSIGFNGLGNDSDPAMQQVKHPLVWVLRKNFMFAFAKEKGLVEPASGTQGFPQRCMPVFHPEFEPFCDRFGQDLADTANDPYLLGIMTDNELQCPVDLLDRYLGLDPTDPNVKHGREAAERWLKERKGTQGGEITQRDRYQFIAYAFERYYQIVSRAVRKYDPNHLYLGSRLNYHTGQFDNPWFWKALAPYHDAVSVNYYGSWGPQARQFAEWYAWSGRPVLLTEWYAKALEPRELANVKGAGWLVRTQEDRGRYYQHFVLNALEIPSIVAVHWFKYRDDPPESMALDSVGGANKGMVNIKDEPYAPLVDRARAVNGQAYRLIDFFDARRAAQ